MCGIYASTESAHAVAANCFLMEHRGPDDFRMASSKRFRVGFVRLAIKDTHTVVSQQPHTTLKDRIVAFNGEIYNYKKLDPETGSEVELLGDMLDERLDPRQYIDGDYAIIYFDPSNNTIDLYRDRFGVCPLYYQLKPYVAVSSERRRLIHPKEVPAHGHVRIQILKRQARVDVLRHYGVTCDSNMAEDQIFRRMFDQAVWSRATHTDTGFALALSGGLDSSAIAFSLANAGLKPDLAICVAMGEDSTDLKHARQVASQCGFKLKEVILNATMLDEAEPEILEHLDGSRAIPPLKWRASVRNWFVAQHAPCKVILCGEGADEMFEGYPPHPERLKIPYRVAAKQLSAIRSLPKINLDRTNKLGLAWSKEYRAPFLASSLSYFLMSNAKRPPKSLLRGYLAYRGADAELCNRGKWSEEEVRLDATFQGR